MNNTAKIPLFLITAELINYLFDYSLLLPIGSELLAKSSRLISEPLTITLLLIVFILIANVVTYAFKKSLKYT